MCGIVGVVGDNEAETIQQMRRMNSVQVHRGPDGAGEHVFKVADRIVAFGHRRLAILDLSDAGKQPMENTSTGDWIVYNGEIYNYPELRLELEQSGTVFHSHCDTEMILHAFARWGTNCFDKFRGMFAIVIYHRAQQRLVFSRDAFGIKPLYFGKSSSGLFFSSELRSIKAGKLIPIAIDRRALAGLLAYGSIPEPLTIFQNVKMLKPGTYATVELNQKELKIECFSYYSYPRIKQYSSRSEAVSLLRDRLNSSARSHLLSDVPVGIFLSSGLDSTALATLCADAAPNTINTFTVDFSDNPAINENPIAQITAKKLRTQHHSVQLTESDIRNRLTGYLHAMDQPTVDGLNTYIIAGAVRELGIKVALSGLGGDELFGGYHIFRDVSLLTQLAPLVSWIPVSVRKKIAARIFSGKSKSQRIKAIELCTTPANLPNLYFRRRRLLSDLEMYALGFIPAELNLNEDFLPPECEPTKDLQDRDSNGAVSILESRFFMGNTLLRDSDVFGMAHGLEIRVPLLDRDLADLAYSLPGSWKTPRNGLNKPLLADAMAPDLDPALRKLPKRGFTLPQSNWMCGPLRGQFESNLDILRASNYIEATAVTQVWQDFLAEPKGPTWSRAWMLGVLGAWLQLQVHA